MAIKQMRDIFFDELYMQAEDDKDLILLSVDLGAPSLDKFREKLKNQFINVKISEQNAILVAAGWALRGKKVYVYGLTEFLTLRAFEQIKIYLAGMNLPVTVLGMGAGVAFSCDGMTHHAMEQLSILRTLPNINLYNCSDNILTKALVKETLKNDKPRIVLFDKISVDKLWGNRDLDENGFSVYKHHSPILIVATGVMSIEAYKLSKENSGVGVIDIYRYPVGEREFAKVIGKEHSYLITLEENTTKGGLGSYILELCNKYNIDTKVKIFGLNTDAGYKASYLYPSRKNIRQGYKLNLDDVSVFINKITEEIK